MKTIKAPEGLPQGFYYLISSHNQNFGAADNVCYYTSFWASDLSIVMRQRHGNGKVEGFVLDALSGEPVAGAKIRAWFRDRNVRTEVAPTTSDANGKFSFNAVRRGYFYWRPRATSNSAPPTIIITTATLANPRLRSHHILHRPIIVSPGSTIEFKGLCYPLIKLETTTVQFQIPS